MADDNETQNPRTMVAVAIGTQIAAGLRAGEVPPAVSVAALCFAIGEVIRTTEMKDPEPGWRARFVEDTIATISEHLRTAEATRPENLL